MRLTKSDRDAFVRAVINDIPPTDYVEQAKALVLKTLYDVAPLHVQKVHDEAKKGSKYKLDGVGATMPSPLYAVYSGLAQPYSGSGFRDSFPEVWKEVQALAEKHEGQMKTLSELEGRLTAVIAGCSTLKQAKERLPEFEKYLPKERDATGVAGLPMVTNVVADLVKLGWPKDQKAA